VSDTGLSELIDMQIRQNGPMSISTYMGLCLQHPRYGYYAGGMRLGAEGDFITAPEISQMFGELIGFFLVNLWQQMKEPPSFTLLELGPGRGTLMADALRAATRAPGFGEALHLQLFESNTELRRQQAIRLSQYHPYWQEEIDAVGDGPLLVVANEFFDALPIRQFVKTDDGWHERQIGLADGRRTLGLAPGKLPEIALPPVVRHAAVGEVFEAGLAREDAMRRICRVIARQGGAILAIDYGYARTQTGETLQAMRKHEFADMLETPGEADISAHVDFEALGDVARREGLVVPPVVTQRHFLQQLGIEERAAVLARANPNAASEVTHALARLIAREQMGELFKVLCAHAKGLEPAGFAA
jgi:SAM-dependent MidA family methyltransferase